MAGLTPLQFAYDNHGRLSLRAQDSRTSPLAYDAQGNLASITNPLTYTANGELQSKTTGGQTTTRE